MSFVAGEVDVVVHTSGGVPSGTVTFLFTDMEGSSPAWDRHGPAMAEAQAIHDTILRGAITRANGYVFSTGGDGVGAAFSRAEDALAAAVDAQRALGVAAWPEPLRLKVRMGMHTGEALEREGDYYGPAVIRAARLMSLVDGGRIVCSLATQEVVRPGLEPGLDLVRIGTVRLKGLSLPEQVFAVLGPGLAERGDAIETARDLARSRPRELSRIIGRAREIDELTQRVLETWLVTLTGAGGVGKTRLALAVAEAVSTKFPDGVAWVELAPAAQTDDVAQAVADCLGVRAQPGEALTATVCAGLRGQRLLMVLDNCEHVLSGAAELVAAIGDCCADVVVLATSRERLGLDGERVVPVAPLATGSADTAAVELLVERMDPWDPSVEKDHVALVEIAARVDGLPLALELAAARCRSLGPTEVAARLRDEFALLTDRTRRLERHQTLDQVLQWSYDLLGEDERRVLQRVSVFASPFTLEGAEHVAGLGTMGALGVDDIISSLVDKSMIERLGGRFRLLEMTRRFAASHLAASSEESRAREALTRYVVDRVRTMHEGLHGPDEAAWVNALDTEWPDVRNVVRRALDDDAADDVVALITHLAYEAFYRRPEAFVWINEAVVRYRERIGPHRHELLGAGAIAAFTMMEVPTAMELGLAALAADPAPGAALDCLPEGGAAGAWFFAGDPAKGAEVLDRAIAAQSPSADTWTGAQMQASMAIGANASGAVAQAGAAANRAVELATLAGNPSMMAYALGAQGAARGAAGADPALTVAILERARAFASEVRNHWVLSVINSALSGARAAAGDLAGAVIVLMDGVDDMHRTGWAVHAWAMAWLAPGWMYALGRHDEAALLLGGCAASGTAPAGRAPLPPELEALLTGQGDPHLLDLFALGGQLTLPELIRYATGQQPVLG